MGMTSADRTMRVKDFYTMWNSVWQDEMVKAYETGEWSIDLEGEILNYYGSEYHELRLDMMDDFFALYELLEGLDKL